MKIKYIVFLGAFVFGCNDDNPSGGFPQIYDFSGYDQMNLHQYIIGSNNSIEEISINVGSLGQTLEEEKMNSLNFLLDEFDLREIILLNADSLKIKYYQHGLLINKDLAYDQSNGVINIIPNPSQFLTFDIQKNQFQVSGVTFYSKEGLICSKPDLPYDKFVLEKYTHNVSAQDYMENFHLEHNFCESDTIILNVNHIYYGH